MEFSTIVKIHKYKALHEGHDFILMAMEVHNTPKRDMDHFIKECAGLFHDRRLKGQLSLFFCIQFFKQHVSIAFQHALVFAIHRKVAVAGDVCFKPPIIIKSHNFHVGHIRGAMVEIASYHERD
jgi:hypothetical protein